MYLLLLHFDGKFIVAKIVVMCDPAGQNISNKILLLSQVLMKPPVIPQTDSSIQCPIKAKLIASDSHQFSD